MKRLLEVFSWYFGAPEGRCYPRTPILLPLAIAIALLLVAAGSAQAHGGRVLVVDQFGNVRAINGGYGGNVVVSRGFHGGNVVVGRGFNNRSFFNQNGGRNRIGFRR